MTTSSVRRRTAGRLTVAICAAWLGSAASAQPVELRIPNETVAPGGVLQAKLEVTEPRPIFTGGGGMSFGAYDEFLGLAVQSANGDAAAVGVMRGAALRLRMVSPTSTIGSLADYPILTTTLRVPQSPPATSVLDMTGAVLTGPGGVPLQATVRPGVAAAAPGASVIDVTPGSAFVPAGSPIVITGLGFEPGNTRVRLKDTSVVVEDVSTTAIILRPTQGVTMHGEEVQIEIGSTRQRLSYFSYQRTVPYFQSRHPLLGAVEPAFPRQTWTAALVRFAPPTSNDALGAALQNEGSTPAQVSLTLVQGAAVLGPLTFTLPANARVVASLGEMFGAACGGGCTLRMAASVPIGLFGLAGDIAADAVAPLLPTADVATVLDFATAVNAATYRAGDLFAVTGTFTPGLAPLSADAYAVLLTPAGDYWSLTASGLQPGIRPLLRGTTVTAASTIDLLRLLLPSGVAPGRYQWLSALATPGTLNLLTPIRVSSFSVVP